MTEVGDQHLEQLALREGKDFDSLSEEVFLIDRIAVLLSPHQLPLDPAVNEGSLGWRILQFVFLLLLAEAVRGREYCVGAGIGGLASETRPPSTAIKPQPPWSWGPDV